MFLIYWLLLQIYFVATVQSASNHTFDTTLTTLTFGSCNQHHAAQKLWKGILNDKPEVFLWLGDIVFSDMWFFTLAPWSPITNILSTNLEISKAFLTLQFQRSDYQEVLKQIPYVLALSDDHEIEDNFSSSFPFRMEAQNIFLDFLQEAHNSTRRTREGVYTAYSFGSEKGKRVKLILLDTRFENNVEKQIILSDKQWEWLDRQLTFNGQEIFQSDELTDTLHEPELILIGSSFPVVANGRIVGDGWVQFPSLRYRLFQLILQKQLSSSVLFLSGDTHFAQFSTTFICSEKNQRKVVRKFIDVTSSGLTHSLSDLGIFASPFKYIMDYFRPLEFHEENNFYPGLNYGKIAIDWQTKVVNVEIKTVDDQIVMNLQLPFSDLQPKEFLHGQSAFPSDIISRCATEKREQFYRIVNISDSRFALIIGSIIVATFALLSCIFTCNRKY
jgi:alkaline phosphatase D